MDFHKRDSDSSSNAPSYIVEELCSGGDLFDLISREGGLSSKVSKQYFRQIVSAISYVHAQGFSHGDLKPENILLDSHHDIKLADFGFSSSTEFSRRKIGTPGYMSPELRKGEVYSTRLSDVFSLGVTLFVMRTGTMPFKLAEADDKHYKHLNE